MANVSPRTSQAFQDLPNDGRELRPLFPSVAGLV